MNKIFRKSTPPALASAAIRALAMTLVLAMTAALGMVLGGCDSGPAVHSEYTTELTAANLESGPADSGNSSDSGNFGNSGNSGSGEGEITGYGWDTDPDLCSNPALSDLMMNLFRRAYAESGKGENFVMSPLSLTEVLAMTANGAKGETQTELEELFGVNTQFLSWWLQTRRDGGEGDQSEPSPLLMSNSIWIRGDEEKFTAEEDYLKIVKNVFGGQVYRSAFDETTARDINKWCENATDGMIDKMIEEIDPQSMAVLLNAICFDGKWEEPYEDRDQIQKDDFFLENGETVDATMMESNEQVYLEDDSCTGFLKPYKDGYSFMALLPKENSSMAEFAASMDGSRFSNLIDTASEDGAIAVLPQFKASTAMQLKSALKKLGVSRLFDVAAADLDGIGISKDGNLFVSEISQKAVIEVDAEGTRAAAVTMSVKAGGAPLDEERMVRLDRPFLYAIIDDKTHTPVFLGVVMNPEG